MRAIESIARTHKTIDGLRVIVVDDGLPSRPTFSCQVEYINGQQPFCFSRNANLGISACGDEDVFLMNDDITFISKDGIQALGVAISSNSRLGLVTPSFTRKERAPSQRFGYLDPGDGLWIETRTSLTFAAVYIRRELIRDIGSFDESFVGYGYEDNDFCWRARLGNYLIGVLPEIVVAHGDFNGNASSTFRHIEDFERMFFENRIRFVKKWGKQVLGLDEGTCLMLEDLVSYL